MPRITSCVILEHGPVELPFVIVEVRTEAGVTVDVCRPFVVVGALTVAGLPMGVCRPSRGIESQTQPPGYRFIVLGEEMSVASAGGFPGRWGRGRKVDT